MKRIVNIAKNKKEADEYDILQQIRMSPDERQRIAKELKQRYYGKDVKDVRSFRK